MVVRVDGGVQVGQLSENETVALSNACLAWKEAEKGQLILSSLAEDVDEKCVFQNRKLKELFVVFMM